MLMYLCRVYFLITLDLYKAYFKGHHIREVVGQSWVFSYSS